MREVEEQLSCDRYVNGVIKYVASRSRFIPSQEIIFDELTDRSAFFCQSRIRYEIGIRDFDYETTVFPLRGIPNLDVIISVAVIPGIILKGNKKNPGSRRDDFTLLQVARSHREGNPGGIVLGIFLIDRIRKREQFCDWDLFLLWLPNKACFYSPPLDPGFEMQALGEESIAV